MLIYFVTSGTWVLCRYRGNCCQYPQEAGYLVTPAIMLILTLKKQFYSRYWQQQKIPLTKNISKKLSISECHGRYQHLKANTTPWLILHGFFQFQYQESMIFFSCRHLLTVDICKHHIFYPHRQVYAIVNLRNKKEILVKHQPEPRNQLINTKRIRLYEACSVYFNFTVKNEK